MIIESSSVQKTQKLSRILLVAFILILVPVLWTLFNQLSTDPYDGKGNTWHSDLEKPIMQDHSEDSTDTVNNTTQEEDDQTIIIEIFHNGAGPMCIEALDFFDMEAIEYEEHLVTDSDFSTLLSEKKTEYNGESEGVSDTFGFYPIIFIEDKAFSGFDEDIENEIRTLIN